MVAASSRRTEENVASRKGSGRHCLRASRARGLSLKLFFRQTDNRVSDLCRGPRNPVYCLNGQKTDIPKKAPNHVLEQPNCLLVHELSNHVAQDSSDGIEALVSLTDVC